MMAYKPCVLVTGASGFVGRALIRSLLAEGYAIKALVRPGSSLPEDVQRLEVEDIAALSESDWEVWLGPVDVVVHCAALVHQMAPEKADLATEYERVNHLATRVLAGAAAKAGVTRFVYLSTIKVLGEATEPGQRFHAGDTPVPDDPYAVSKLRGEEAVAAVSGESAMEFVTIRLPLCYGPDVGANFQALFRLVKLGLPLPLGAINNRRSMVALGNLVDLILLCLRHPNAANQTLLVSDGDDVSTTELLRRMADAMQRRVWLVPIPESWLIGVGRLFGKEEQIRRLCGSLQVDISQTRELLGWTPPVSMARALREMVES